MTKKYSEHGIEFAYPENWKLTVGDASDPLQISLESPQGCIWDLYLLQDTPPKGWIEQLTGELEQQYESFEQETLQFEFGAHSLEGIEAYFYCLDLLITAHILTLPELPSGQNPVLMYQGESREFDTNLPVFQAMGLSLLND